MHTIYNETGRITGTISAGSIDQIPTTNCIKGNYDGNLYYIVDNVATERPELLSIVYINKNEPYELIANDNDLLIISNLPVCCFVIEYEDQSLEIPVLNDFITDGTLEFQTNTPGTILITIDCFPYKRFEIEVEAING